MRTSSLHWIRRCDCGSRWLCRANKPCCCPPDEHENDQNSPILRVAVSSHRKMIADHEKNNGHRYKSIVLGAQLGLRGKRRIEPGAGCCDGDQFALSREDSEPYVGGHNCS